jgi:hypothetical protein
MIVTHDYYWGWAGGFLCGVAVSFITFFVSKSSDYDDVDYAECDSVDAEQNNCDDHNCVCDENNVPSDTNDNDASNSYYTKCPVNYTDGTTSNVFFFRLTDEMLKIIFSNVNLDSNVNDNSNDNSNDTKDENRAVDDFETLLEEELKRQRLTKTHSENSTTTSAPVFRSAKTGGYATFQDLENAAKYYKETGKHTNYSELDEAMRLHKDGPNDSANQSEFLSTSDEKSILITMNDLVGQNYYTASNIATERGYFLYPIYVGLKKTSCSPAYSKDVIGVRIKDDLDLIQYTNGMPNPTQSAIITEIIDVGGNDRLNRGAVNL